MKFTDVLPGRPREARFAEGSEPRKTPGDAVGLELLIGKIATGEVGGPHA